MSTMQHFTEYNLPASVPPPEDYSEIILKKPWGRGSYRLKCKVIKISKQTALIEAYSRLVKVRDHDGYYHYQILNVTPYRRRVKSYYVQSSRHFIENSNLPAPPKEKP